MTNEEFKINKQAIIDKYKAQGISPEKDFDGTPLNDCAKELTALLSQYRHDAILKMRSIKFNPGSNPEAGDSNKLKQIYKSTKRDVINAYQGVQLAPIYVEEHDLKPFSEEEKACLRAHYANLDLNHGDLATMSGMSRQAVTGLLNRTDKLYLDAKLFDRLMPLRIRMSLLKLIDGNEKSVTVRAAEHFKILSTSETNLNLNTKPLSDPEASRLLRELGDKLANSRDKNKNV